MAELPSGPAQSRGVYRSGSRIVWGRFFQSYTTPEDVMGRDADGQQVVRLAAGATAEAVQIYYAEKGQHRTRRCLSREDALDLLKILVDEADLHEEAAKARRAARKAKLINKLKAAAASPEDADSGADMAVAAATCGGSIISVNGFERAGCDSATSAAHDQDGRSGAAMAAAAAAGGGSGSSGIKPAQLGRTGSDAATTAGPSGPLLPHRATSAVHDQDGDGGAGMAAVAAAGGGSSIEPAQLGRADSSSSSGPTLAHGMATCAAQKSFGFWPSGAPDAYDEATGLATQWPAAGSPGSGTDGGKADSMAAAPPSSPFAAAEALPGSPGSAAASESAKDGSAAGGSAAQGSYSTEDFAKFLDQIELPSPTAAAAAAATEPSSSTPFVPAQAYMQPLTTPGGESPLPSPAAAPGSGNFLGCITGIMASPTTPASMAAALADAGIAAGNFWDSILAAGRSSMGGSSSALPASPGQQSPALPCGNDAATHAGAATACCGGMQAPLSPSLLLLNSPAVAGGKKKPGISPASAWLEKENH